MVWSVDDIWEHSKSIKAIPKTLAWVKKHGEAWNYNVWGDGLSLKEISDHLHQVMNADLRYPIILTPERYICDGCHRLLKAIILKKKTIRCKILTSMPKGNAITY
jgi:hypothetical protein